MAVEPLWGLMVSPPANTFPETMATVARWPGLRHLRKLEFWPRENDGGNDEVRRLLDSPHLGTLTHLTFGMVDRLDDAAAEWLANDPRLSELRELSLYRTAVADRGAIALANSPHLRKLNWLLLKGCPIGDAGNEAIRRRFLPNFRPSAEGSA